ncbi:uncharacterized protein [Bemisia tabaci]|uniref:uncharacterized protein isoform X2 n=1 Tax=Bemisia tabaci TaxID=7038 RepID=UPI003B28176F
MISGSMLIFVGMVLFALTAEVGGRPDILPNGEVLQVEDEFAAVRNSADPTLRRKKNMLKKKERLWKGATVIYKMEDHIWTTLHEYQKVQDAMRDIMQGSCVRFKERSGELDYVYIQNNYIFETASVSILGRKGGMQVLSVFYREFQKKTVLHELGHVLGLEDEHRRPDRDHYVEVIWDNLEADRKKFKTLVSKTERVVPTKPPSQLSPGDFRRINDLYRCEGTFQKPRLPFDVVCSFDLNDCGFKGLLRHENDDKNWVWHERTRRRLKTESEGGYLIWSVNSVEKMTTVDHIWSVGFYGTSPNHSIRGQEGCVTFKYSFKTGGKGRHKLELKKVELESPLDSRFLDNSAKSSSEIWSDGVEYRRRLLKKSTATKWTQVSIPVNVLNPFLLDFASILEEGVGEHWVKIDGFEVRYKPCADLNLNRSDSKRSDTNLNRLDQQRSDTNLNRSNSQRKSSWFNNCFPSTKLRWFSRKPSRSAKVTPSISSMASSSISQGKSLNNVHSSFDVENRNKSPRRRT